MSLSLSKLARAGFSSLDQAAAGLDELAGALGESGEALLERFSVAADPDGAVRGLRALLERDAESVLAVWAAPGGANRLVLVLGASTGLAEFFTRRSGSVRSLESGLSKLPVEQELRRALIDSSLEPLRAIDLPPSDEAVEAAWVELRASYRSQLARIAAFDLESPSASAVQPAVSSALADLAAAALDAGIEIARRALASEQPAPGKFSSGEIALSRLAVIGMGKAGASELNYLSDVDVMYVAESADLEQLSNEQAVTVSTAIARAMQNAISAAAIEPPLWEVDANLRPEGKDGALVRTLDSHASYYDRWAKGWEFQAQLKARAMAGDRELGQRFIEVLAPKVWQSAAQDNFVESVQRMRERVTANIPSEEVDVQLKLGPGGLRDIEFTVQLLQLVHGQADPTVRFAGTLPALASLASAGYIGRPEAAEFADDYRFLRVLEHRLQLARLRRTHLMPRDPEALRVLARASGFASSAEELLEQWQRVRNRVRGLHERLFYRPLLAAVAASDSAELSLSSSQVADRLAAIGFRDPAGASSHLRALSGGVSRRAAIHRALLPVVLQWLAEGADPDYGLLIYRRLSESLGETPWYLRMLRDSELAAYRLSRIISSSRFVADLLERSPESVAWLDDDEDLRPRSLDQLREEVSAVIARHEERDSAAKVLQSMRRREVLRLAIAGILDTVSIDEVALGLTAVTESYLGGMLQLARGSAPDGIEFAVIAMGRFGGCELGMGSDADVLYVYRALDEHIDAGARALSIVTELSKLSADNVLAFELDADLRPEGRNGVIARSLEAYRAYYARWSLTWEAQALLRARFVAGDAALGKAFEELADEVRYPADFAEAEAREVRRIKARVESERLPQGSDPARHLKLGRGSLSDVEWFVQLLQLQHGATQPELRTTATLEALSAAAELGLVAAADAEQLRTAWLLASRVRSALMLWLNKSADVLPVDRIDLDGVARLLGYPAGAASALEEDYLAATRRARAVFERGFYGVESEPRTRN